MHAMCTLQSNTKQCLFALVMSVCSELCNVLTGSQLSKREGMQQELEVRYSYLKIQELLSTS